MKRKIFSVAGLVTITFIFSACATSVNDGIDEARFALDSGDYATAVTKANEALTADPTNIEAALLLAAAYAGRAGITVLDISDDISDADNADSEFQVVRDALATEVTNFDDLRSAIVTLSTTLTPQPTSTHDLYGDHQFQLGLLETIEALSLPSITAKAEGETTPTVSRITAAIAANVQADFVNADDHLINAGMAASDALVQNIRKVYWATKNVSPAGTSGFTTGALQDINLCQLHSAPDTLGAGDFQEAAVATCASFAFATTNDTTL